MKVVLRNKIALLEKEFGLLRQAHKAHEETKRGLPLVTLESEFITTDHGAGYAMSPVGLRHAERRDMLKAFKALIELHCAGIVHGDPR